MELKVRNVSMAQFIGDNYPTTNGTRIMEEKTHFGLSPVRVAAHLETESMHTIK